MDAEEDAMQRLPHTTYSHTPRKKVSFASLHADRACYVARSRMAIWISVTEIISQLIVYCGLVSQICHDTEEPGERAGGKETEEDRGNEARVEA